MKKSKPTKQSKATKPGPSGPDVSEKVECPSATLESLFGITDRAIQLLAKQGVVKKVERGRYLLWESIRGYVGFCQERMRGSKDSDGDYEKHRAELYLHRARKAKAEADLIEGTVHDGEVVAAVINEMIAAARTQLLALGTKAGPLTADESDPNKCKAIIDDEVRTILTELSDYPAAEVVSRQMNREREDAEADEDMPEEPPADGE